MIINRNFHYEAYAEQNLQVTINTPIDLSYMSGRLPEPGQLLVLSKSPLLAGLREESVKKKSREESKNTKSKLVGKII